MTKDHHNPNKPKNRAAEEDAALSVDDEPLVNADAIGARYGVTGRYILKLAAEGRIPCLRIGLRKCVRFSAKAVARALETPNEKSPASEA
jgi:hypothetical protein